MKAVNVLLNPESKLWLEISLGGKYDHSYSRDKETWLQKCQLISKDSRATSIWLGTEILVFCATLLWHKLIYFSVLKHNVNTLKLVK